jgi:DNA-3-methyladenine glycosylase II
VISRAYKKLSSKRQLSLAARTLAEHCAVMRAIHARTGTPPLREFTADFAGLAKIVTGQQLSAASAKAIWSRVEAGIIPFDAATIHATSDARLASFGLSSAKIRTLKTVAAAVLNDGLDFDSLAVAPDDIIIEQLTALHGIGPWTADIFLLFALRRADAFAPGDLALQLAAQHHFKLKNRPTPAELEAIAERWRPWRGAAARLLWADYATARTEMAAKTAKSTARKPIKSGSRR